MSGSRLVNRTRGGGSWSPRFVSTLDANACTRCGFCVKLCPAEVFVRSTDGAFTVASADACWGCSLCERLCKDKAIRCLPIEGFGSGKPESCA
ncbi:MAG: 4Fe-4S binding protein [Candidatus Riflebacteria bacterium]|nr:4Fe-4S binding protein [Candidatus Riflebacteria bacterium]